MKKMQKKKPRILRFSNQDQILFTKRLAMILKSGMPIMQALAMLKDEARTRSSIFIFESLITDVSHGKGLSEAVSKFRRAFGEFSIQIIRVGETSGTLHENLEYLSQELKKKQALRRQVYGALIYPALIVACTFGITIMLTVFIFPKIIPVFQSVHSTLPFSTRALIAISKFLSHFGLYLIAGLAALVMFTIVLMRYSTGFHLLLDHALLRIPILGKLSRTYNLTNICRTMSLLLKSDTRIVEALELVAASTKNLVYRAQLLAVKERMMKGQRFSMQFKGNTKLFPVIMAQMISVGESTGDLAGTLSYLSLMYEDEISDLTKNLTTLLEPILMIVMGLIVGFIAISIITPIYSITSNLNPR
ncbi:type II secretion system F family protein [Candidatus Kaiserbacteria bacterium]|nr:type II secretion system F family protein [Candidatus Kaiserbacteria bacterium]